MITILYIQPDELPEGVQGIQDNWNEVKKKERQGVWPIKVNRIEVRISKNRGIILDDTQERSLIN